MPAHDVRIYEDFHDGIETCAVALHLEAFYNQMLYEQGDRFAGQPGFWSFLLLPRKYFSGSNNVSVFENLL